MRRVCFYPYFDPWLAFKSDRLAKVRPHGKAAGHVEARDHIPRSDVARNLQAASPQSSRQGSLYGLYRTMVDLETLLGSDAVEHSELCNVGTMRADVVRPALLQVPKDFDELPAWDALDRHVLRFYGSADAQWLFIFLL